MTSQITLPLMGEGVVEAQIGTWLKAEGDAVAVDEPIVEIETDKVTTELVAEQAGQLLKIVAASGDVVEVGQLIAVIGEAAENGRQGDKETRRQEDKKRANGHQAATHRQAQGVAQHATRISPVVSRMLTEHDLDIHQISGTGKHGRVTKQDVLAYLEQGERGTLRQAQDVKGKEEKGARMPRIEMDEEENLTQITQPAQRDATEKSTDYGQRITDSTPISHASPFDELRAGRSTHHIPHSSMRRRIAEHMVMSKATSPHATTVHEIDYSAVKAHRKTHKAEFAERGVKLTYMAYLAMAVIKALQAVPNANSSWQDDGLLLHREVHLGIAAAVDDGLVVPVIKQADTLNLLGMAQAIGDLAEKARAKQLAPADIQGGTFTITNHGVFGSLFATPIINQPQAGILGIGVVEDRVVAVDGMVGIRPKAYASFSFDHRILDGADADHFMQVVRQTIEAGEF